MINNDSTPAVDSQILKMISLETWILVGSSIFLVCWLFPPGLYERLVGDANYLFCDSRTLLFNLTAIALFFYGAVLTRQYTTAGDLTADGPNLPTVSNTEWLFGGFLLLIQGVCLLLLLQHGVLRQWLAVSSGQLNYGDLYNGSASRETNPLIGVVIVVTPYFLPWVYWLWLSNQKPRGLSLLLWSLTATYLLIALAIAKRNYIARPLFGMILVHALYAAYRGHWTAREITKLFAKTAMMMAIVFVSLQIFRSGSSSAEKMTGDFTRYIVGTYNSQAMIQNDVMKYEGGGTGYYWTAWIWNFPVLRDILPLEEWREEFFGVAAPYGSSERGSLVRFHGVTGTTALSTFGNSYVDFGWLGVFPFAISGAIAAFTWQRFCQGELLGVVLYPLIAYSVIDWRGNLSFPGVAFGAVLVLLLVLKGGRALEAAALRRRYAVDPRSYS